MFPTCKVVGATTWVIPPQGCAGLRGSAKANKTSKKQSRERWLRQIGVFQSYSDWLSRSLCGGENERDRKQWILSEDTTKESDEEVNNTRGYNGVNNRMPSLSLRVSKVL